MFPSTSRILPPINSACEAAPFTPRMTSLLDVKFPDGRSFFRSHFLNSVLNAVDNRVSTSDISHETLTRWGMEGKFGSVYETLKPHIPSFDTDERLALWTLKGLDEVYKAGDAPNFNQALKKLDIWKVSNQSRLAAELAAPPVGETTPATSVPAVREMVGTSPTTSVHAMTTYQEYRLDALESELFCQLGLGGLKLTQREAAGYPFPPEAYPFPLEAGYCPPRNREYMAIHLAQACREIGLANIAGVRLVNGNVQVWNDGEPKLRAAVPLRLMYADPFGQSSKP